MGDPDCEARLTLFPTISLPPDQLYVQPDSQVVTRHITEAAICRAVYTNRQLLERMVEFWSDHFNTNISSVGVLKTPRMRNVYLQHALGTFPAMLNASASSPAMLIYLNNTQSDGRPGRTPNQNYARELLELHTLGVDGGYTQQDVVEVARCFTGWRTTTSNSVVSAGAGPGTFYYDANRHDNGSKLVLGMPIAAGGGINDGLNVLNIAGESSEHRPLHRQEDAAVAAHLRPVAGARRRHRRRVHAERRQHQVARPPHPALRQRAHGAAALQAAVSLHRLGAARHDANVTVLDTIRGTYLSGTGNAPFAWGPPDGYPQ